ncbi:hypothetical protein DdX_02427 [Ditylenchus destructor]|uniref:Uncharacterized protein n=1 Tax=Ditylenchus destructor TaxID=166010 RepID=A0AAD4NCQ2_9BILA|nr:hypothetical protein DdX_02427 [Ditylenchus destructor]
MDQPSLLFSSRTRRTPNISKMFVPVVNKDMQLFPANRQTLPPRIKNVRSRAQSLEDNLQAVNHAMNGNAPSVTANAIAGRQIVTVRSGRQRNAQSVGSLPTSPALALIPPAKSPPKLSNSGSMRKPLDPIVEGVPLASSAPMQHQISECSSKPVNKKKKASDSSNNGHSDDSHNDNKENPSSSSCTTPSSNKSTPDLHDLRIRPSSSLSTASAPGLEKTGTSPPNSGSSAGKGIVKWITNTLKGKNGSRDKESTNGGGKQPVESPQSNGGSLPVSVGLNHSEDKDYDNTKPWRSLSELATKTVHILLVVFLHPSHPNTCACSIIHHYCIQCAFNFISIGN